MPRRTLHQRKALHEPDDAIDAARWRALFASARLRILTTTPQPYSRLPLGARYLIVELTSHSDIQSRLGRHELTDYADFMIRSKGDKP